MLMTQDFPFGGRYYKPNTPTNGLPIELVSAISDLGGILWEASDFTLYTGPNTAGEAGGWLLTETAAGAGNAQRVDIDDSQRGGVLKMLTDNGDNDTEILQRVGEPWRYVLGNRMWFGIKVKTTTANDGEMFFGLAISDTSPIATLPTDGLFFEKAETATAMDFHARKGGTSTELSGIDPAALADATFRIYQFSIDTTGQVSVYVNGVLAGTVAAGNANMPDTEDLALVLAYQTGTTAAKSMDIDWYYIATDC
jgi:hypothetical protein